MLILALAAVFILGFLFMVNVAVAIGTMDPVFTVFESVLVGVCAAVLFYFFT